MILLGHTRDDQAEQVLLGLARGSGARSLSGMPPTRGSYVRPLLGVSRTQTQAACAEAGLEPWLDPHNDDSRFARTRARRAVAELERAAALLSAAAAIRGHVGARLTADDQAACDGAMQACEAALGPATFADAWAAGRTWSVEHAIECALQPL